MHASQQSTSPPTPQHRQALVLRECAICQSSIYPTEQTTTCPSCALVYHAECWQMNLGCASYGCEQVHALAPKQPEPEPQELPPPSELPREAIPWSFLLLGAATLALMLSMLTYGIPSAVVGAAVGWRTWKRRRERDAVLLAAAVLCTLGVVLGVMLSRFWFGSFEDTSG